METILDDVLNQEDEVDKDSFPNDRVSVEVEDKIECNENDIDDQEVCKAFIANSYQYNHAIEIIACGLSFWQTVNVIGKCKMLSNDTKFGFISRKKVTKFVRIHCALSLQITKQASRELWCFSIALDSGNKSSTPHLDVRLRFVLGDTLYNVHLLAIPMFESHTDLNMFNSLKKNNGCLMCWLGKESARTYIRWSIKHDRLRSRLRNKNW